MVRLKSDPQLSRECACPEDLLGLPLFSPCLVEGSSREESCCPILLQISLLHRPRSAAEAGVTPRLLSAAHMLGSEQAVLHPE